MGQDETYGPTKKTQDTIKYLCDIRDQLQKGEAQWEKVAQPIDPDELLRLAEQRGKRRRNKQKARSPAPAPAPTTPIINPSTLEPNAISTISQEASQESSSVALESDRVDTIEFVGDEDVENIGEEDTENTGDINHVPVHNGNVVLRRGQVESFDDDDDDDDG